MKLRRSFALLIAVLLLISAGAFASDDPVYVQYNDTGDPVGWLQDCIGVTETYAYNYSESIPWFGDETMTALKAFQKEYGLKISGEFDADTLYALLEFDPFYDDPLVWIPMYGGERYHANYWCSAMIEPRQMPESCAEAFGFTYCKRCYK